MGCSVTVTLGDRIIERVRAASLEELARATFFVSDDAPVGEGDADRVTAAIQSALARKNQFAAFEPKTDAGVRAAIDQLAMTTGAMNPAST